MKLTEVWFQRSGTEPLRSKRAKTNHIERFNNTLRQRVSRLLHDTLSFSKKLANHIGAIKFFICHYNLARLQLLPWSEKNPYSSMGYMVARATGPPM